MLSFVITAIVCAFTALCYAEFASMVPISGSAYTYSYATLGELVAWIIGWDLIIEYAVGNVAVAISWANYFRTLLENLGINIPAWLATDYRTAARLAINNPSLYAEEFGNAPHLFGHAIVFNLFAFGIVALITIVLVWGIRESAGFNAIMVMIKIMVLLFFIGMALYYVSPAKMVTNWKPFQPTGWHGTLAAAAVVFFAYIGFDAVSTVAEETKNPGRDLPIGIIASLVICTVFYVVVAAVFTGIMPYSELVQKLANEQAEPLTMALSHVSPSGVKWPSTIVAFGSVVAHTAVLLVFQLGQPRIFFSMARDGLLPSVFASVHPRFKTPHVTTILTGVLVGGVAAFASIDEMVDLTNIGTLFAFVLVCVGIPILRFTDPQRHRPFRVPSNPWLWFVPIAGAILFFIFYPEPYSKMQVEGLLVVILAALFLLFVYPQTSVGKRVPVGAMALPFLGASSCFFLMYYLPPASWWRFVGWLMLGLAIYTAYGYARSDIGKQVGRPDKTPMSLKIASLGFFAVAVGLFIIPHDAGPRTLFADAVDSLAEGHGHSLTGLTLIIGGLVLGGIGLFLTGTDKEDES
jgi:APA family basic amino acid/polyamine antiporter